MKTLQEQYNLLKEGKGHKGIFMKEAKRLFPNIVPNAATYNQTTKLLKQRSVISENIFPLMPSSGLNPFTTFDKYVNEEVKATEKKTTKEINQAETAGYDYKDPKNLNNQIFDQYLNGLRVEMEKDPKLTMDEAKEVVAKNLEKDPIFYTKNAAFKVDGLGYEELKQQGEPTGKYKSSGYGDLKENKMSKSEDLKELLEENRLTLIDRTTITELMTFVHKGTSYEADRGYHDDMVMNCVLFSWFITTPYFEHLTDKAVKTLLYSEQQKLIEDDLLPAGVFGALEGQEETFVDVEGDRWFVDSTS